MASFRDKVMSSTGGSGIYGGPFILDGGWAADGTPFLLHIKPEIAEDILPGKKG